MSRLFVPSLSGLVFSTVLGVDTATLDTGANAIPAGGNIIDIYLVCRTDESAVNSSVGVSFNGDGNGNYDTNRTQNSNATVSGVTSLAQTTIGLATVAAGSNASGVASSARITIPAYAATTFNKSGVCHFGISDPTAGSNRNTTTHFEWRSTAAINQITFAITSGSAQKFKAGSALYVYVR